MKLSLTSIHDLISISTIQEYIKESDFNNFRVNLNNLVKKTGTAIRQGQTEEHFKSISKNFYSILSTKLEMK